MAGIYGIRNKVTGKIYVGKATYLYERLQCHRSELERRKHINKYLQEDWLKYGKNSFEFILIKNVEFVSCYHGDYLKQKEINSERLREAEIDVIKKLSETNLLYNIKSPLSVFDIIDYTESWEKKLLGNVKVCMRPTT